MRPYSSSPVSLVPQSVHPGGAVLLLQGQPVSNHGDELAVGGLSLRVGHRVAKVLLEGLQVAPEGVVAYRLATSGYKIFVTALMTSISRTVIMMASLRY